MSNASANRVELGDITLAIPNPSCRDNSPLVDSKAIAAFGDRRIGQT
jgi:hypothetical protein